MPDLFGPAQMPLQIKEDMCRALLDEFGATGLRTRAADHEINCRCVLPWHNERNASASLNWEKLAYRCLGCDSRGGILWLIATLRGDNDADQARAWLEGQTGLGGEFNLNLLLEYFDAVEQARSTRYERPSLPKYSERVLDPWSLIYPGLTTGVEDLGIPGRGIPEENLVEARVGWDLDSNRIIIPHWVKGDLVGWQSRRILDDGTPKYLNTPDFPRDSSIYGKVGVKRSVWVESPMSRLRHLHHLPMASTFGAAVTPVQREMLKWTAEAVLWPDPDEAGWRAVEGYDDDEGRHHPGLAEFLGQYTRVKVVESEWFADPAEFDDDLAQDLVDSAVPYAVWRRPEGTLRCIACHHKHGGPCAPTE